MLCEFCEIEMIKQEKLPDSFWETYICPKCNKVVIAIDSPLPEMRKYSNFKK